MGEARRCQREDMEGVARRGRSTPQRPIPQLHLYRPIKPARSYASQSEGPEHPLAQAGLVGVLDHRLVGPEHGAARDLVSRGPANQEMAGGELLNPINRVGPRTP